MSARASRELAFLRLVERGAGRYGWHAIETYLSGLDVPFTPGAPELGKRLGAIGMVTLAARSGSEHATYAITERGAAFLRECEQKRWSLGPAEAEDLGRAFSGEFLAFIEATRPFANDAPRFDAVVRQLLALGIALDRVAYLVQIMPEEYRPAIARAFVSDPREPVRAALFRAGGGPGEGVDPESRFLAPGGTIVRLPEADFEEVLRLGLGDASLDVRMLAARLAYTAERGEGVSAELVHNLSSERADVRAWSAAALGTARDAASLEALRRIVAGSDEGFAAAAARGLAGRPEAHADLISALADPRPLVRRMANLSLGFIAKGLSPEAVARIERELPAPEIATALAYYRARERR